MAHKRDTTPLFEVLQHDRHAETRMPEPVSSESAGGPAAPPSKGAGFGEAPIRVVGGIVQMPLVYAAVALAMALAAVLGAWALGYRRGESEARSQQRLLESALGPGAGEARVVEPGGSYSEMRGVTDEPVRPRNSFENTNTTRTNTPVPVIGQPSYLVGSGMSEADPRLAMHNYLQLGSQIRASEVVSAIEFLGERGLDCFGVIDPRTRGRNDGPLYVLFAGLGVPSGEADSPEARRYREQVLAAGAAWKAAGGVKDFDDAGWVLYKP